MKILLISSSPHKEKSSTFQLAKDVLKGLAQEGVNTEIIHLEDLHMFFCKHCEACHKEILNCILEDDVPQVLDKMLNADGIILASPNYINQVTASMKALFERSAHFIHCKRLLGKYIAGVVTSGSGFDKPVLDYIKFYANTCGAQYSGGVSSTRTSIQEKAQEGFKLGARIALDIREKREYPEQLELIEKGKRHFAEIIKARKEEWRDEYKYWLEKGWLK
jgi:multimeric flavodoxin WrbA